MHREGQAWVRFPLPDTPSVKGFGDKSSFLLCGVPKAFLWSTERQLPRAGLWLDREFWRGQGAGSMSAGFGQAAA